MAIVHSAVFSKQDLILKETVSKTLIVMIKTLDVHSLACLLKNRNIAVAIVKL